MSADADLVVLAAALLLVLDGVHIVHHHRAVGLARAAANRNMYPQNRE